MAKFNLIDGRTIANGLKYTARVIREGRNVTRTFEDWFENGEDLADVIAAGLYFKAWDDEALRNNLFKYLGRDAVMRSVDRINSEAPALFPRLSTQDAVRKSRHGGKDWISFLTKSGERVVAHCTPSLIKRALLEGGTQADFTIVSYGTPYAMNWKMGINRLRNAYAVQAAA